MAGARRRLGARVILPRKLLRSATWCDAGPRPTPARKRGWEAISKAPEPAKPVGNDLVGRRASLLATPVGSASPVATLQGDGPRRLTCPGQEKSSEVLRLPKGTGVAGKGFRTNLLQVVVSAREPHQPQSARAVGHASTISREAITEGVRPPLTTGARAGRADGTHADRTREAMATADRDNR